MVDYVLCCFCSMLWLTLIITPETSLTCKAVRWAGVMCWVSITRLICKVINTILIYTHLSHHIHWIILISNKALPLAIYILLIFVWINWSTRYLASILNGLTPTRFYNLSHINLYIKSYAIFFSYKIYLVIFIVST